MIYASEMGHKEVVELLLERKANLEAKANNGACLAHSGVHNKHNTESRKPAEHTAACDHEFISILFGIEFVSPPCLAFYHFRGGVFLFGFERIRP